MAFPVVEGTAETAVSTAGTSHTITLPSSIAASDLVLIIMDIGSTSATLNALADWAEDLDEAVANGLKILRYTGAGVPSNPTFTSSASTRSASIAYRISGADKGAPQIGTTATGTSTTPNPPSVTPTGGIAKDYLSIAFFGQAGEEADDDTWANTPPTNWTPSPPRQKTCGTAGTSLGGLIASAERQINTGSALDPGTFAVDVSAAWRAQHILIHPAPVTGTVAETLDPFTSTASGTAAPPPVTGTSTVTLGAFTPNASGGLAFTGTSTVTLGAFTSNASGGLGFTGTVAETLDPFTSNASGTVAPPEATGTVAETLDPFTSSASGTVTAPPVSGSADVTLGVFVPAASGTVTAPPVTGTAAVTLGSFVAAGSGSATAPPVTGAADVTLGVFVSAASGSAGSGMVYDVAAGGRVRTADNGSGLIGTLSSGGKPSRIEVG